MRCSELTTHSPQLTNPKGDDQPGIAPPGKERLASQVPRAPSTARSRASGGGGAGSQRGRRGGRQVLTRPGSAGLAEGEALALGPPLAVRMRPECALVFLH
jgi:hypothetical protein